LNSSSGIEELLNILNKCNTARLSNGSSAIEELRLCILKDCNIASWLNSSSEIEELLNILIDCNTASLSNGSSAIEELHPQQLQHSKLVKWFLGD
jgi:hypothetical protein